MLRRWRGLRGERRALRHLQAAGLRLVARNWQCRFGEIDLVMADGETLVFVEVRVRAASDFGDAADSVHPGKQSRLVRAASMFVATHGEWQQRACRFDVVAIDGSAGADALRWIRGAFDAGS
ncbi:YraN family protein [Halomonas denitrificans]|nr:YraN family protein [Halomonas denitrificans]